LIVEYDFTEQRIMVVLNLAAKFREITKPSHVFS
jgi:hypothetical protein